jgi:hypothetical protein
MMLQMEVIFHRRMSLMLMVGQHYMVIKILVKSLIIEQSLHQQKVEQYLVRLMLLLSLQENKVIKALLGLVIRIEL